MRDVLLSRVRPLVERFADDLAALAVRRVETELARIGVALDVALSAYQSDVSQDVDSISRDVLADALGPQLAAMLTPPDKRQRDYKPENYPPSRRAREERAESQANGKKPITCKTCGFVGGNARGCGTAHETKSPGFARAKADPDDIPMTAVEVSKPRVSPYDVAAAKARIARIASRAKPVVRRVDHEPHNLANPVPEETLASATTRAVASKHTGELPHVRSSFEVTPPTRFGEAGDVEEIDFGGAG